MYKYFLFLVVFYSTNIFSLNIFVFNPESPSNKSLSVQSLLKSACKSQSLSCNVQIFAKSIDFENSIKVGKPDIAIVASYFYQGMKSKLNWEEILSGYHGKVKGFNKVLVTSKKITQPSAINYISAVAANIQELNPVEKKFIKKIGQSKKVLITTVSKEIDAMMGLAFEQVDGAIVTEEALNQLTKINPNVTNPLKIFKKLPVILYPKIVIFQENLSDKVKITSDFKLVISELKRNQESKIVLSYFGVTDFK